MDITSQFLNRSNFDPAFISNDATSPEKKILERKIVVMDKQECIFLNMDDISCAEAHGAYTNVYLMNGETILVCKNLKAFSGKLPESEFLRVHKSYIVNINYISKYVKSEGGYLILENGKQIPVSARRKDVLTRLVEKLSL